MKTFPFRKLFSHRPAVWLPQCVLYYVYHRVRRASDLLTAPYVARRHAVTSGAVTALAGDVRYVRDCEMTEESSPICIISPSAAPGD